MKIFIRFAKKFDLAAGKISAAVEFSVVIALMGLLGFIIVTIFSRYIFRVSAPWVPELVSFGMAYIAAFGFSCLVQRKNLLTITFLRDRIPRYGALVFDLIVWIFFLMYFQLFVTQGVTFAENVRGQLSPSGVFNLVYPRLIIPAGGALIVFQAFNNILQDVVKLSGYGKSPDHPDNG